MASKDSFGAAGLLRVNGKEYQIFRLNSLEKISGAKVREIPYSIRILLENLLRFEDERKIGRASCRERV